MVENYETSRSESDMSHLKHARNELENASFSLDHVLFELGQIYECFISQIGKKEVFIAEKTMIILTALPLLVSELIFLGHNFQILDGESSNVPIIWVKSVFDGIRIRKGDAKLHTISVLGIQSSGKSTLLNSMFGLQFNVSAGRCTRGVYTQLIPVLEKKSSERSYLMVIDTEGLRAPELLGRNVIHDNELATFAIGLGDFVLVNLKGETISDMKDVLEIVIHGLLRLWQADNRAVRRENHLVGSCRRLKQSCTIIHQNVSAIDAKVKMLQGHQKIIEILDQVTKYIADKEEIPDISAFKDVFAFDPLTSIKYVPDLWHGSPPMAPTSTKYSHKVMDILNHVRTRIKENIDAVTAPDMFHRLQDLWNGILQENFVFCFRNSLELKAYAVLDIKFKKLGWEMEKAAQAWIESNVNISTEMTRNESNLSAVVSDTKKRFFLYMDESTQNTKLELSSFLEKATLKEHMIHWKGYVMKRVDALRKNLEIQCSNKIQEEETACLEKEMFLNEKMKEIDNLSRSLAKSPNNTINSDENVEDEFNRMFDEWMKKKSLSHSFNLKQRMDETIHLAIIEILESMYENDRRLLLECLAQCPVHEEDNCSKAEANLNLTRVMLKRRESTLSLKQCYSDVFSSLKVQFKTHLDQTIRKLDAEIKETITHNRSVGKTELLSIISSAKACLFSFKNDFTIGTEMEIDFVLLVSRRCYHAFVKHNKEMNDWLRESFAKGFKKSLLGRRGEIIAANLLISALEDAIWNRMTTNMYEYMERQILDRFNFSKFVLLKETMTYLISNQSFGSFMKFVSDPNTFTLQFITSSTIENFFKTTSKPYSSNSPYRIWAEKQIDEIFSETVKAIEFASGSKMHFEWVSEIRKQLCKAKVDLDQDLVSLLKGQGVQSIAQIKDKVTDQFVGLKERILEKVDKYSIRIVDWQSEINDENNSTMDKTLFKNAFDILWGCKEACPWCNEPCIRDTEHDDDVKHRCIQHRPGAICGMSWKESGKLCVENCNFETGADNSLRCSRWCKKCEKEKCDVWHPIREYYEHMPDWDIECQPDMEQSKFWNWFVSKYSKELAKYHGENEADIPNSWKTITMNDALQSLDFAYRRK